MITAPVAPVGGNDLSGGEVGADWWYVRSPEVLRSKDAGVE